MPEVDPKRDLAFDGAAVAAALDGETLDALANPNRLEEDVAGTFVLDVVEIDPNRLEDIAGAFALEVVETDPNRVLTFDCAAVDAALDGEIFESVLDPKRLDGGDLDGTLASEAPCKEPKRDPALCGAAVEAALEGGEVDEVLASEALGEDPKREYEMEAGLERAPSKPNGEVDAAFVFGGAALPASVPEVEEDDGGVMPANLLPVGIFVRAAGSGLGKNEPVLGVDEFEDAV